MDKPTTTIILLLGDPQCGKSRFLSRLSQGTQKATNPAILQDDDDDDQLFTFTIRIRNRAYSFNFYNLTTHSAESYTQVRPDAVIICYAIDDRRTLENAKQIWGKTVIRQYTQDSPDEDVAVMLLGLKRDLRVEQEGMIYPQEGHRVAQEMRCDRYAECSAVTGELMNEVCEDIALMAVKNEKDSGQSGPFAGACILM